MFSKENGIISGNGQKIYNNGPLNEVMKYQEMSSNKNDWNEGARFIFEKGGETLSLVKSLIEKYPEAIPDFELDELYERYGYESGLIQAVEDLLKKN